MAKLPGNIRRAVADPSKKNPGEFLSRDADVFADVLETAREAFLDAAVRAADELGVFALLRGTRRGVRVPLSCARIADTLGVSQRRLARLLDVLVAEGVLTRSKATRAEDFRTARARDTQYRNAGDWNRMPEVIRSDSPLQPSEAALEDHLRYVDNRGRFPARILWETLRLRPGQLLDMGGGLGAYSFAFLDSHPQNRAVLIDLPQVIDIFAQSHAAVEPRLRTIACDAREYVNNANFDVVLLANLLHLYGEDDCLALVERAAAALAPGGTLVLKDLCVRPDRSGPLIGLYFALNMAIYTEAGDVHTVSALTDWLQRCGLADIEVQRPADRDDGTVVVVARRGHS